MRFLVSISGSFERYPGPSHFYSDILYFVINEDSNSLSFASSERYEASSISWSKSAIRHFHHYLHEGTQTLQSRYSHFNTVPTLCPGMSK